MDVILLGGIAAIVDDNGTSSRAPQFLQQRAVSYNREKGYRKLVMPNGDFRYVYDVLILQINDTKILVK
jgi:hypothetical protein